MESYCCSYDHVLSRYLRFRKLFDQLYHYTRVTYFSAVFTSQTLFGTNLFSFESRKGADGVVLAVSSEFWVYLGHLSSDDDCCNAYPVAQTESVADMLAPFL
jgi:hypothetical protein